MTFDELITKGEEGEAAFADWLNTHNLGYVHISQGTDMFAHLFGDKSVKRPDFFMLIESIGMIAVDVKNKQLTDDDQYTISNDDEVGKILMFERMFRIPIWYAFWSQIEECWYWISGLKALELKSSKKRTNSNDGSEFLMIPKSEFVRIEDGEDIAKLYTHCL